MARMPRSVLPGYVQHVIHRGNNGELVFRSDEDKRFYLDKLREVCRRYEVNLHSYVLMPDHVNLLLTPSTYEGLSKAAQSLGTQYVRYFNRKYDRRGTLWEGRYRATILNPEEYALVCYRFIEISPVRAGLCCHPAEYPWSSYRCNALGARDASVTPHGLYNRLGYCGEERRKAYRALCRIPLSEPTIERVSTATEKGWILGNDAYAAVIENKLNRRVTPIPRGGDRRSSRYKDERHSLYTPQKS